VSDNPQKRSTSFAKTVDLEHQNNALDRARALNEEFQRAKAARGHSLEHGKSRGPEPPVRATSHAKAVDLDHQKNALDRAASVGQPFARAVAVPEHAREQQNLPRGKGRAETAHAPRPEQHLRLPDGQIRRAVDKQIDAQKQRQEDQRARQANEELKARLNRAKSINRNKDMDRDM
jgi:hypothetical protein